jgi:hypothetical protein
MPRKLPMPAVIPCERRTALAEQIEKFAEVLKTESHKLGLHGLSEEEFYTSGLLAGAIQRIRGQYSATMTEKRDFVARVLRHMEDEKFIKEWESAGGKNRFDYSVTLPNGRVSVIELKGCLDGNNTAIFERPSHAQEFILWSVCISDSADPRLNAWSGIHTRLGVKMIEEEVQIDGLVVWDWICGTPARPCPKLARRPGERLTAVGQYQLTPPCIYLFPKTIPSVRNNPDPAPHKLSDVGFLEALNNCFGGYLDEINTVRFKVAHKGGETMRTTSIERDGKVVRTSSATPIRRK